VDHGSDRMIDILFIILLLLIIMYYVMKDSK
jgi:hypothetical protein